MKVIEGGIRTNGMRIEKIPHRFNDKLLSEYSKEELIHIVEHYVEILRRDKMRTIPLLKAKIVINILQSIIYETLLNCGISQEEQDEHVEKNRYDEEYINLL